MDALKMQDATLQGVAKYYKWKKQFMATFQESMMKGQLKQAWAMMPAQMKEWLKKNDPQGYQLVMSIVEKE